MFPKTALELSDLMVNECLAGIEWVISEAIQWRVSSTYRVNPLESYLILLLLLASLGEDILSQGNRFSISFI